MCVQTDKHTQYDNEEVEELGDVASFFDFLQTCKHRPFVWSFHTSVAFVASGHQRHENVSLSIYLGGPPSPDRLHGDKRTSVNTRHPGEKAVLCGAEFFRLRLLGALYTKAAPLPWKADSIEQSFVCRDVVTLTGLSTLFLTSHTYAILLTSPSQGPCGCSCVTTVCSMTQTFFFG